MTPGDVLGAAGIVPTTLAAHGVGGPADLPVPLLYSIVGATWALTLSFVVLVFAWREPRFTVQPEQARARRPWLAAVGLGLAAWLAWLLFFGPDDRTATGLRAVYIYLWVGLVPVALLLGTSGATCRRGARSRRSWDARFDGRTVWPGIRKRWATGQLLQGSSPSSGWNSPRPTRRASPLSGHGWRRTQRRFSSGESSSARAGSTELTRSTSTAASWPG